MLLLLLLLLLLSLQPLTARKQEQGKARLLPRDWWLASPQQEQEIGQQGRALCTTCRRQDVCRARVGMCANLSL
jgi:hypothetical protein